jgi:hypothetical protein
MHSLTSDTTPIAQTSMASVGEQGMTVFWYSL